MFCPTCGTENAQGANFCRACGRDLVATAAAVDPLFSEPDAGQAPPGTGGGNASVPYVVASDEPGSPGPEKPRSRARWLVVGAVCTLVVAVAAAALVRGGRLPGGVEVPGVTGDEGPVFIEIAPPSERKLVEPVRATPEVKWSWRSSGVVNRIVVDGTTAFVVDATSTSSSSTSSAASVAAVDLGDGSRRWSTELESSSNYAELAIVGDTVVVSGSVRVPSKTSSYPESRAHVWALDTSTGKQKWEKELEGTDATVQRAGDRLLVLGVYAGGDSSPVGELQVVDPRNGEKAWGKSFDSAFAAADGTRVYVTNDEQVSAFAVGDGSVVWKTSLADAYQLAIVGSHVVVSTGQSLTSLDAGTGDRQWESQVEGMYFGVQQVSDRYVLVSPDSSSRLLSPTDGSLVWRSEKLYVRGAVRDADTISLLGLHKEKGTAEAVLLDPVKDTDLRSATIQSDGYRLVAARDAVYSVEKGVVYAYDFAAGSTGGELWSWESADATSSSGTDSTSSLTVIAAIDAGVLVADRDGVHRLG